MRGRGSFVKIRFIAALLSAIAVNTGFVSTRVVAEPLLQRQVKVASPYARVSSKESSKTQIWFAPLDPILRPEVGYGGSADFMNLFDPNAPWATAAAHVKVFKLYSQFVQGASDADLTKIIRYLDQHQIQLALEAGLIPPRSTCLRTEGYAEGQGFLAQRIRRLGGNLRYVMADEPLFYGHSNDAPGACRSSIAGVAKEIADSARLFQQVFPDVRIVEAEPISSFKSPDWVDEIGEFLSAFRREYGHPFAAVALDIAWWEPSWRSHALSITRYLRQHGERVGVFYNGNAEDNSNAAWLNSAREHYRAYEVLVGAPPDLAIFQSWAAYPTSVLPEAAATTFTNLILEYSAFRWEKSALRFRAQPPR